MARAGAACETAGCLCGRPAGLAAAAAGGGAWAGNVRPLARSVVDALRAGPAIPSFVQVVDELVSNALDAGARNVEVELDFVRMCVLVRDDGSGMAARDLDLLGERHATSKLPADRQARLLASGAAPGGSLGFRGEALHALSQCATVEVR
jgi:DNA mismatch repair protein MutL